MWFRIYAAGYKVRFLPEVLVKGRVHAKQISRSIGFSYHNPEQDMFWSRSLQWLRDNQPGNVELLVQYGKNACMKTRFAEGNQAFDLAASLAPAQKWKFAVQKNLCMLYALLRTTAKNLYLKIMR